jgi:hypothetical protein
MHMITTSAFQFHPSVADPAATDPLTLRQALLTPLSSLQSSKNWIMAGVIRLLTVFAEWIKCARLTCMRQQSDRKIEATHRLPVISRAEEERSRAGNTSWHASDLQKAHRYPRSLQPEPHPGRWRRLPHQSTPRSTTSAPPLMLAFPLSPLRPTHDERQLVTVHAFLHRHRRQPDPEDILPGRHIRCTDIQDPVQSPRSHQCRILPSQLYHMGQTWNPTHKHIRPVRSRYNGHA